MSAISNWQNFRVKLDKGRTRYVTEYETNDTPTEWPTKVNVH